MSHPQRPARSSTSSDRDEAELVEFLHWVDPAWFPIRPAQLIEHLHTAGAPRAVLERVGPLLTIPGAPLISPAEVWRAATHPALDGPG